MNSIAPIVLVVKVHGRYNENSFKQYVGSVNRCSGKEIIEYEFYR